LPIFDFDRKTQEIINKLFSLVQKTNWKSWLTLGSIKDYEELTIKNAGLTSVENLNEKIEKESANSTHYIEDLNQFLKGHLKFTPLVLCHTSGTTNSNLKALKWFNMTGEIVKRFWAPGMQAIFESSGLNSHNSAVIFVPSRLYTDGLQSFEGQDYLSLYSSEFSQRIMLSIIKPSSYLCSEYKNSTDLEVIAQILSLDNVSVISAPAATVLKWADLEKLRKALEKSKKKDYNNDENPILKKLLLRIEKEGIEATSKYIQEELSKKFEFATLIFSITSLSENDWNLIRKFMNWEKGKERFTNLYVASEIGPFASSITLDDFDLSRSNQMYVLPLTFPVIESNNKKVLISRCKDKMGRLYVSRHNSKDVAYNIDVGDVITVKDSKPPLPIIHGKILRGAFVLKYPIKINNLINVSKNSKILAGDYFSFPQFEINEPRILLNCIKKYCKSNIDSMLLEQKKYSWNLYLEFSSHCDKDISLKEAILECPQINDFSQAILNDIIKINILDISPVNFLAERETIINDVRQGKKPKGLLKKWPLYLLLNN
jgi:hypothetical protein